MSVDKVVINDLNPSALELARFSGNINKVNNIEYSEEEICRFFSRYSKKGNRASIVDIDPFGSPAQFFDCGLRATMHGGILSCTATDLQVLNGLFQNTCKRKYGGIPIRTKYGNEIAIRLILGCLRSVSGRLGLEINPLFVESNMHYYRIYVRVYNRPDQNENLGYIIHCKNCAHRKLVKEKTECCELCGCQNNIGGPLWNEKIFEGEFVEQMILKTSELNVHKTCEKSLQKCLSES
ncbi:MAG: tRNA (guanine-N1)-methyltransferase, partial [Nitrosopumilaceae archaeon]